jgi:hypothetical protein
VSRASVGPAAVDPRVDEEAMRTAERVRAACVEAAVAAYEDAGIRGLCAEGRWEAAIGALQQIDLSRALAPGATATPSGGEE